MIIIRLSNTPFLIKKKVSFHKTLVFFLLNYLLIPILAQQGEAKVITLEDAVNMALSNHPTSKNAALSVEAVKARKTGNFHLIPADITCEYGQINSPVNDNRLTISQNLGSPLTHIQQNKLLKNEIELSQTTQKITQKQLIAGAKAAYYKWVYQISVNGLMEQEAELYEEFFRIAKLHFEFGDSNILKKTIAETKYAESQRKLLTSQEQLKIVINNLNRYIYSEETYEPSQKELELYTIRFPEGQADKFYPYTFKDYFQQQVNKKKIELSLEKSYLFPEVSAGYFHQRIDPFKNLNGFRVGVSVPLWFLPQTSKIKVAKITSDIAENNETLQTYELEQTIDDLKIKLDQEFINVIFFRENALAQADLLLKMATHQFQENEIAYTEFLQSISEALKIKQEYLNSILNYNLTAIELEYYLN